MSRLAARFFGYPAFELDGVPVNFERRKTTALLVYILAGESKLAYGRESLAALFWPELGQAEAGAALRHALWEIHRTLGDGWIDKEGQTIGFLSESDCWVDVLEFQILLEKAQGAGYSDPYGQILILLEAIALARQEFLAGFSLRDSPEFDRWQVDRAGRLHNQLARLLETLTQSYGLVGEHDAAIASARRWLSLDPLNEAAHRALIQSYSAAGQRLAALRQYDECARILKKELGVIPEPATRAAYQRILAGGTASAPPPTLASAPSAPVREPKPAAGLGPAAIPVMVTPFIGRETEIEKICALLAKKDCRLVSLIGPGGIGKTRTAVQAAQSIEDRRMKRSLASPGEALYPDGVFFIPLAEACSLAPMIKKIAGMVGCPFREEDLTPGGIADNRLRLMHFLSRRKCLLVLDNLEQIEQAAALVHEICLAAPGVTLLTTSRHRLNLAEEWVFELSGMPVPGYREKEQIQEYSSVQLFIQNAVRATGDFEPGPQDWPAIGRICQLVAGMPLGIELAAAWVRMFSCAEIAAEIEQNLDFLYSSARGVPERHQSLRAVFEYSWRLLSERERSVIRKLSVFCCGFSREMAGRVAGATLPMLTALMDQSLVHRSPENRFELHEVLKQYAREKLAAEAHEEAGTLDFHSETYLDTLEELGEQLKRSGQESALQTLDAEVENIEMAWERAVEQLCVPRLLRALPALVLYFETSNQWARAREVLNRSMERFQPRVGRWRERIRKSEPLDPEEEDELALLAMLQASQKRFIQIGSQSPKDTASLDTLALELANYLPPRREKALAYILNSVGPHNIPVVEVLRMCHTCVEIFSSQEDIWGQAVVWLVIGDTNSFAIQDLCEARRAYEKSLDGFLRLGNEWGKAVCYNGLGLVAEREGNLQEARSLWKECVAVFQKIHNIWRTFDSRQNLARVLEKIGAYQEAALYYQENVQAMHQLGQQGMAAWLLYQQARAEMHSGQGEQARLHHQEAQEIYHQIGDLESAQKIASLSG